MQNKIELERKMREEKIKKLIQKSKPPSDTVKNHFSIEKKSHFPKAKIYK